MLNEVLIALIMALILFVLICYKIFYRYNKRNGLKIVERSNRVRKLSDGKLQFLYPNKVDGLLSEWEDFDKYIYEHIFGGKDVLNINLKKEKENFIKKMVGEWEIQKKYQNEILKIYNSVENKIKRNRDDKLSQIKELKE